MQKISCINARYFVYFILCKICSFHDYSLLPEAPSLVFYELHLLTEYLEVLLTVCGEKKD